MHLSWSIALSRKTTFWQTGYSNCKTDVGYALFCLVVSVLIWSFVVATATFKSTFPIDKLSLSVVEPRSMTDQSIAAVVWLRSADEHLAFSLIIRSPAAAYNSILQWKWTFKFARKTPGAYQTTT